MSPQQKADVVVNMLLEMIREKGESETLARVMLARISGLSLAQRVGVLVFFKNLGAQLIGGKL